MTKVGAMSDYTIHRRPRILHAVFAHGGFEGAFSTHSFFRLLNRLIFDPLTSRVFIPKAKDGNTIRSSEKGRKEGSKQVRTAHGCQTRAQKLCSEDLSQE